MPSFIQRLHNLYEKQFTHQMWHGNPRDLRLVKARGVRITRKSTKKVLRYVRPCAFCRKKETLSHLDSHYTFTDV